MDRQRRVFIIYGYYGRPSQPWFQKLKADLTADGVDVIIPDLPTPEMPDSSAWVNAIGEAIGEPNKDTYVVAHSLGCIATLQYLDSLSSGAISGAVLVAGFLNTLPALPELDKFISQPFGTDHVKQTAGKVVAINSDDDPVVPIENADLLQERLGAEVTILRGAGHIHEEFGITELPIVVEKLHEMMYTLRA